MKTLARLVLLGWTIGFPVVSCAPLLATGTDSAGATGVGILAAIIVGGTILVPWLIGVVIFGIIYAVIPSPQRPAVAIPQPENIVTKLTELNELYDRGIVTDEEYAAKRAELMARL
jgi:hypothetical protein